jgi:hypothetical protein
MQLSSYCLARGRYELAEELHAIGTEWYEREIVSKTRPGETNDHGQTVGQILEEYRQRLAEFPLLVATRTQLLESLNSHSEGIDREKLKNLVKHEGSTAFGVICNQLARRGWLRQEKTGKNYMLYPESTAPASDELFVREELPAPAEDDGSVDVHDPSMDDTGEIPEGYELIEADPIIRKPMTPELQAILDDARQAGYLVNDDPANDGMIVIRPYHDFELDEDWMLSTVPKPAGTPLISRIEDRELHRGLIIWPDHTARRMDVKYWLAEAITDYAVMRSVLGLEPRPASEPEQPKQ